MKNAKLLLVLLVTIAAGAACVPTPTPAATPTVPAVTVIYVQATPLPTDTPLPPTATPSRVPTPFITPPAAGQNALVPILMYHHLSELDASSAEDIRTWVVTPKSFEAQIDWIAQKGYHTISMAQLISHLREGKLLPAKPIIVSFDDGWEEQYAVAYPVLKKHGYIGTFFIYTNAVDRGKFMTWQQLVEMSAAGMDIQSHTVSHPHLKTLDATAAAKELVDSKSILEKHLGKPVVVLDYPFGEYNESIIDLAKRAGYEAGVGLAPGFKQGADALYTLHRIRVSYDDSLDDLAKRLPP